MHINILKKPSRVVLGAWGIFWLLPDSLCPFPHSQPTELQPLLRSSMAQALSRGARQARCHRLCRKPSISPAGDIVVFPVSSFLVQRRHVWENHIALRLNAFNSYWISHLTHWPLPGLAPWSLPFQHLNYQTAGHQRLADKLFPLQKTDSGEGPIL